MLAPPSPTVAAGTWPRLARRGLKRPRGLWKARRRVDPTSTPSPSSGCTPHGSSPVPRTATTTDVRAHSRSSWRGSDTDREEEGCKERTDDGEVDEDDEDEMTSEHSGSSKRQRRESADSCGSANDVEIWASFVEAAEATATSSTTTMTATPVVMCAPSPQLELEDQIDSVVLIQDMVTTSIAERANGARRNEESYEYSEWESVKGTLKRASELYDGEDFSGSISLLRAVVHECHRLLDRFPDPSKFFTHKKKRTSRRRRSSSSSTSSSEDGMASTSASSRNIAIDRMCTCSNETTDLGSDSYSNPSSCHHHHHRHRHRHSSRDSPNAFHAVLGVALFLFGNLISQNSSLAISREPTAPDFYWRAALDVFDAGDNLPSHTDAATLINDPDHPDHWRMPIYWGRTLVALAHHLTESKGAPPPPSPSSPVSPSLQRFAPRSPLTAIAAMHTPSFAHPAHAHELLKLAVDQFSCGIFHMPHTPQRQSQLFTLASEVLIVAERLDGVEERRRWASWVDAVFNQMHMEADVDAWRTRIVAARGRCALAMGSARADEFEDALERGDKRVLNSREAEEARTALATAVSFFDRAQRSATMETSLAVMQPLLAEALLSLANLTADNDAREVLYARAKAEGGESVARDLGPSPTRVPNPDVLMDES